MAATPSRGAPWSAVGAAVAVLGISACSTAVEAAPAPRADEALCAQVASAWPTQVGGNERVETTVDSPTVAAWGDPAIIARCGVTSPGPTTDECLSADGVDWVMTRLDDGMRFVTYGRDPAVEVLVPSHYAPEPMLMSAFSQIGSVIPQGERRCM